ncbi:SDR family oxidoreductase [Candidatus Pacearchaeota archaeon]|nr:SDR family oxidoreductase [Candidatus Pacearchaeota archaeon]
MKQTVLITGASKGFGKCLSLEFAKNNYNIIIQGRNQERLDKTCNEIKSYDVDCDIIKGDLRNQDTLDKIYEISKNKNIILLINNAAMICPGLSIDKLSFEQIEEMINTNLLAVIKLTKLIMNIFIENKKGSIININSLVGLEHKKNRTIYAASKWGLRGFTNSLNLEAQDNNINAFSVFLSKMKTESTDTFGMNPNEVANKVYNAFLEIKKDDLIIDGRPPEFRPKKNGS